MNKTLLIFCSCFAILTSLNIVYCMDDNAQYHVNELAPRGLETPQVNTKDQNTSNQNIMNTQDMNNQNMVYNNQGMYYNNMTNQNMNNQNMMYNNQEVINHKINVSKEIKNIVKQINNKMDILANMSLDPKADTSFAYSVDKRECKLDINNPEEIKKYCEQVGLRTVLGVISDIVVNTATAYAIIRNYVSYVEMDNVYYKKICEKKTYNTHYFAILENYISYINKATQQIEAYIKFEILRNLLEQWGVLQQDEEIKLTNYQMDLCKKTKELVSEIHELFKQLLKYKEETNIPLLYD